jgi:hypothetical protein
MMLFTKVSLYSRLLLLTYKISNFEQMARCEYKNIAEQEFSVMENPLLDILNKQYNNKTFFDPTEGKYKININPCLDDKCTDNVTMVDLRNVFNCGYHYYVLQDQSCKNSNIEKYYLKMQEIDFFIEFVKKIDNYFKVQCKRIKELAQVQQLYCYSTCADVEI